MNVNSRIRSRNRNRRGQNEVITTVILITIVLILAAVFIIISMINFSKASSSTSLSLASSFFTDVADDLEASMYNPGTVLVYPVPQTQYGTYNTINDYCTFTLTYSGGSINFQSGAVLFGVPPGYLSLPQGYVQVIRGSTTNGAYSVNKENLIISNAAAPLISIVQFGTGSIDGVTYGTYIVLFPRVLVVSTPGGTYVYVPIINTVASGLRNTLVMNVTNIYVMTIPSSTTSPLSITINGNCGPLSDSYSVSGVASLRIVVINVTATFR